MNEVGCVVSSGTSVSRWPADVFKMHLLVINWLMVIDCFQFYMDVNTWFGI